MRVTFPLIMLEMDYVMMNSTMKNAYLMEVIVVDLMSIHNIVHFVYVMKI